MDLSLIIAFCREHGLIYKSPQKTADLVSIKVGGNASLVVYPFSLEKLIAIVKMLINNKIRFYILGNGTNTYFSENDFEGIIIVTKLINKCTLDNNSIIAECGASLYECCVLARDNSLSGIEFAYGIPGTVGGALYMNASAFGSSVSLCVKESLVLDKNTLQVYTIDSYSHSFEEKKSVFSKMNDLIVLSTVFSLKQAQKEEISAKMEGYMNKRVNSQPLDMPSAGSVFKKPQGNYASHLIDSAGLRGLRVGGAMVSEKHAGFIVNLGNATAGDIQSLTQFIKEIILKKYNVKLEEEIIFVE